MSGKHAEHRGDYGTEDYGAGADPIGESSSTGSGAGDGGGFGGQ